MAGSRDHWSQPEPCEPESLALVDAVRADREVVASDLALTEVIRAVARAGGRTSRVRSVLDGIGLVPLDGAILRDAATLAPRSLRTLDALHLATAMTLVPDLAALITYDRRLADAAVMAGLAVESPGTA